MSKSWKKGSDTRWRKYRLSILQRDRWQCTLKEQGCTTQATQVHHIRPLSRGGQKYDPANCTAACRYCNLKLGDRIPIQQPQPRPVSAW